MICAFIILAVSFFLKSVFLLFVLFVFDGGFTMLQRKGSCITTVRA